LSFLATPVLPVCYLVDQLLAEDIATCDPIRMEVLAGARREQHLQELRGLLARASAVPTGPVDFEAAAALYRTCRQRGRTVRRLMDCLIAAVAIRADIPLLHLDTDFEALVEHTALEVYSP
jgi:predicted nucleic acid-binding protein